MDMIRACYNVPSLMLKENQLVITGLGCIERGITINAQDFHIDIAIFHLKHNFRDEETTLQLAGRVCGEKSQMPECTTVIAPESFIRFVSERQQELLEKLQDPEVQTAAQKSRTFFLSSLGRESKEDKDYRLFSSQEEGIAFAKEHLGGQLLLKNNRGCAELKNMTWQEILKDFRGLNAKSRIRLSPTVDPDIWILYFRPSFFTSEELSKIPPASESKALTAREIHNILLREDANSLSESNLKLYLSHMKEIYKGDYASLLRRAKPPQVFRAFPSEVESVFRLRPPLIGLPCSFP
jgi:hypothetical protein